jgi:hypothetical protein
VNARNDRLARSHGIDRQNDSGFGGRSFYRQRGKNQQQGQVAHRDIKIPQAAVHKDGNVVKAL